MRRVRAPTDISLETGMANVPGCSNAVCDSTSSTSVILSGTLRANSRTDSQVLIGSEVRWTSISARWSASKDCISTRQRYGKAAAILALILACSPVLADCRARTHVASIPGGLRRDGWMNGSLRATVGARRGLSSLMANPKYRAATGVGRAASTLCCRTEQCVFVQQKRRRGVKPVLRGALEAIEPGFLPDLPLSA